MIDHSNPDVFKGKNYELRGRLAAPEQFVDGVSLMFIGNPMTKMILHTVTEPRNEDSVEIRRAVQCLTMTTVNAIEFADFILRNAKKSESMLLADLSPKSQQRVKAILSKFESDGAQEPESPSPQNGKNAAPSAEKTRPTRRKAAG